MSTTVPADDNSVGGDIEGHENVIMSELLNAFESKSDFDYEKSEFAWDTERVPVETNLDPVAEVAGVVWKVISVSYEE